jgi:hypothetical protein
MLLLFARSTKVAAQDIPLVPQCAGCIMIAGYGRQIF